MNKKTDRGIILARTEFGERDRILTVLMRENGKVRVIAKGVRSAKSKLAGGIELLSESDLGFIVGKGEVYTLTSSRLVRHFGNIVQDYDKTQLAYEAIKTINKVVEDGQGQEYYPLLLATLGYLDKKDLPREVTATWFYLRLLDITGHSINLKTAADDKKLTAAKKYAFDYERNCFYPDGSGVFSQQAVKLLRVVKDSNKPVPANLPVAEQARINQLLVHAVQEAIR